MAAKQPDRKIAETLKRLDELAVRTPALADAVGFYKAVFPVLHEAQMAVEEFPLAAQAAQRKLLAAQPVLIGEELPLDEKAARALFLRLCRAVESLQTTSAAKKIRRAVERRALDLVEVWAAAQGDRLRLESLAIEHQLDLPLLAFLAQTSLRPALRAWVAGFKQSVDTDMWGRGCCPMCGSPPLLAEIQGKEGERRLRCACGADWAYPRMQCAFCGNRDHKTLGQLTVAGEDEKYRLQTCDRCRGYLKTIVTFEPTPVDLLAVEDLATVHLDLIAGDYDYLRVPAEPSWA